MLLYKQINKDGHANKLSSSNFQKESERENLLRSKISTAVDFLPNPRKYHISSLLDRFGPGHLQGILLPPYLF